MTITWEYSTDGTNWYPAGSSVNQVYVTLGESQTTVYHTLVHIGCKRARDQSDPDEAVKEIWKEFQDRYVLKVDGKLMKYYGDWRTKNSSTKALLASRDGGCGAWARFFVDVLKVQNIPSQLKVVVPSTATGFYIKDWRFTIANPSSPDANFPFLNTFKYDTVPLPNGMNGAVIRITQTNYVYGPIVQVKDYRGKPGQGTSNPKSLFNDHGLVLYGDDYHDVAYGFMYENMNENQALAKMEEKMVSAYYKQLEFVNIDGVDYISHFVGKVTKDSLKISGG
jgi:hypothetical protein